MANATAGSGEPRRTQGGLPLPTSKRGPKAFYKEVRRELRNVSWPSRQETMRLTGVVLAVCGIVVVILTILSYFFETILNLLSRGGN